MEFQSQSGRIFAAGADGRLLAEVTFPVTDGVADINRTFVDDSLRGQGVAGALLAAAVEQIRGGGLRARATCSYARKWFAGHPEHGDLLAGS